MMIGAQISIQMVSAEGPPLIIALKDVRNFEMQAEEPVLFGTDDVRPPSPLHSFSRQNPQKHLLSRSKCQLIISPKRVFN